MTFALSSDPFLATFHLASYCFSDSFPKISDNRGEQIQKGLEFRGLQVQKCLPPLENFVFLFFCKNCVPIHTMPM